MEDESGAVATELAVLTPVLVLMMLFVVFAGRLGQAEQDLTHAVAEAARVAAIERGGDVAARTRLTVMRNVAAAGVDCRSLEIMLDGHPPRAGTTVGVTARCEVDMTGVAGLGLPRHRVLEATAVEVVDTYRGDG
jgi:Flp pilus assembly protein TadG